MERTTSGRPGPKDEDDPNATAYPVERVASDTSLPLLSGDDDANSRLNAWLNGGGGSSGSFMDFGGLSSATSTTKTAKTSNNAASTNVVLPSLFNAPISRFSSSESGADDMFQNSIPATAAATATSAEGASSHPPSRVSENANIVNNSSMSTSEQGLLPNSSSNATNGILKQRSPDDGWPGFATETSTSAQRHTADSTMAPVVPFLETINNGVPDSNYSRGGGSSSGVAVAGEASSKPPPPPPPPIPMPSKLQHQRTVSFGETKFAGQNSPHSTNAKVAGTSKQSPPLTPTQHARNPSGDSMFSFLTQTDYAQSPRSSHSNMPKSASSRRSIRGSIVGGSGGGINLNDIVKANPLESEAETYIMMAIEKQDTVGARARANTGGSTLLETVPTESMHVFLPPIGVDVLDPTNDTAGGSAQSIPMPDAAQTVNADTPLVANSGRTRSNTIESSQGSPFILEKDKKPALAPNRVASQRPPRPVHKRNVTVAENLASLTEAMAGYHGSEAELDDDENDRVTPSAGEKLAKNANLLFRGRQKTEGKSSSTEPKTDALSPQQGHLKQRRASAHWNKLKAAVPDITNQPHLVGGSTGGDVPGSLQGSIQTVESYKKTDNAFVDTSVHTTDDVECGVAIVDGKAQTSDPSGESPTGSGHGRKNPHRKTRLGGATNAPVGLFKDFRAFVRQRRTAFITYMRFWFLVAIPALGIALILYYVAENPPTGRADLVASRNGTFVTHGGDAIDPETASASWWIIFICIRQALTFSLAQLLQVFIIDFLCLNTRFFVNAFGNLVTLLIVQSKGWPFIVFMWAMLDFGLLFGKSRFAAHWLYWQTFADILNDSNPAGNVTQNIWNRRALLIAASVGVVVAFKRLWLGLHLGRKTFANYAEDLTKIVTRILTLCEVAALARDIGAENSRPDSVRRVASVSQFGITREEFDGMLRYSDDDEDSGGTGSKNAKSGLSNFRDDFIIDPKTANPRGSSFDSSQRAKINELLGAWEDPEVTQRADENVSIGGILQFRNSLAFLSNTYMFSIAWGDCSTRERMVYSSQEVFRRLMQRSSDPNVLKFDVLARVAERPDGSLDHEKLKRLIRLLRPDRDGSLSLLDFVKSVDSVYKEAKLLQASVVNSEKIDRAFERAFNIPFYAIVVCVILGQLGFNPLALFLSLSSLILGFAFIIGTAASKMFEGWLFILVRRPYNIGDRIHISNIESDTSPDGSWAWIVKDVTLFYTTAIFAATGEHATMSNGSLASSRIINMARSPKATVYIYLKFATSVPFERIEIFEAALREFVKARPREWANFSGFRATQVMAELNYIEYVVVLTHREAWQNVISILDSKAKVASFCLELSKKLDMRYQSPPLPVDLAFVNRGNAPTDGQSIASKLAGFVNEDSSGYRELAAMYDKAK